LSHTLNLGIVAHVDAGKTSLTERLLHTAGVIDRIGRVDHGDTQTDSLALERQRGITIKSAVVSFTIDDVTVNLIDTPGHPDFIAEVERVLNVLDGAILVVSAVDGVQAQTRVLTRVLRRLDIPTLIFVNKTDRPNARGRELLDQLPPARAVYFGSALTGDGIAELVSGITRDLPPARGSARDPLSATVFKVDRGNVAYVRVFGGTVRVRDRLPAGRVTGVEVFAHGSAVRRSSVSAGEIARVSGLDVRIGDTLGVPRTGPRHHFDPPTLETVVVPSRPTDRGALHAALTQLAEQDPLINLRHVGDDIAVSLYGEVQKEVVQATLADEYSLAVTFRETTVICVEQAAGTGEAVAYMFKDDNPFVATVGLRVEPGTGVSYSLAVEYGAMPAAFFNALEETVRETLREGLHGWQVSDCAVTVTHAQYRSPVTVAADFRNLAPLVLMTALRRAGTVVREPTHAFHLEVPADTLGRVLPVLARLRGITRTTTVTADQAVLEGSVPAASLHGLQRELPGLTGGHGALESTFDSYQPVSGPMPSRARTDHNPLNRKEYLLHVVRRT
jgi:ribosomal protection tetracycline resistance protein